MKLNFFGLSKDEIVAWFIEQKLPRFRADQLLDWVYRKNCIDLSEMTNLGRELREKLEEAFSFSALELVRSVDSGDGETFKYLWRLDDGKLVESVLICSGERRTVCISSQVGCPARCSFCASGKKGLFRNLTAAEIAEQVWVINHSLQEKGERVSHLVYMGMGEPMENYDAVVKSVRLLSAPEMLQISQRRITVSTVGVVEGIDKLSEEGLKVNLALSLHAPTQELRKKIIHYARKYPLEEIIDAVDRYAVKTKRDITFEYILISGINDRKVDAHHLIDLIADRQCTVNLIPYNPIDGVNFKKPSRQDVEAFRSLLTKAKINHTCRYTKGDDIAAACGQLAIQS